MKCRFCGKDIPEQSKFCRYCGRAQQAPAVADHSGQKQEKKKGSPAVICVIAALIALILMAGAGFFVFRRVTGGGSPAGTAAADRGGGRENRRDEEEDTEEEKPEEGETEEEEEKENDREAQEAPKGEKQGGNRVLNFYLTYMGTEFEKLPESFEREIVAETEGFSAIQAREAVRYAGMDGKVTIEGFEFTDEDLGKIMGSTNRIGFVYWQPDERGEDDLERLLEQMTRDYGEYDGSVAQHILINRNLGEEMGEYTLYYWDNPEKERYDVQLYCFNGECFVGLEICEGEDDSRYLKPLEDMTEAFKNSDVEALKDVLAEEFFISMGMDREDLEDGFEETARITIEVKGVERLPRQRGLPILMMEYNMAVDYESGLVNHIYLIDAILRQSEGGETEEGLIRFITAKKDGKWKILHWERE